MRLPWAKIAGTDSTAEINFRLPCQAANSRSQIVANLRALACRWKLTIKTVQTVDSSKIQSAVSYAQACTATRACVYRARQRQARCGYRIFVERLRELSRTFAFPHDGQRNRKLPLDYLSNASELRDAAC